MGTKIQGYIVPATQNVNICWETKFYDENTWN